jgi:hypothetical protein
MAASRIALAVQQSRRRESVGRVRRCVVCDREFLDLRGHAMCLECRTQAPLAGAAPEPPGSPAAADQPKEVVEAAPPSEEAAAGPVDALEGIQWLTPGRSKRDQRATLTVGESWYLSGAAVVLLGAPARVRIGRARSGAVVIAPAGSDEAAGTLALARKASLAAGRGMRGRCLDGVLPRGTYPVRAERGWLVVVGPTREEHR